MLVEIIKTTKENGLIDVDLPFYYKHDLMPDDRDSVIYGKVCKNEGHSTIHITSRPVGTIFEIEFGPVNWKALSGYLTEDEYKSTEAEYNAAKERAKNAVSAL